MNEQLRDAIIAEAKRIGADPLDFATVMSYETGGTFDPWKSGPTTQWGHHVGLIQMGEPQRKQYGYTEDKDIAGLVKSAADYLVGNGYKPGMSLLDMYSTINAGGPGRYNASDANNGGAPGTVADKVSSMGGHRNNAAALLGGTYGQVRYTDPSTVDLNLPPEQPVTTPTQTDVPTYDPVAATYPINPVISPSQTTYSHDYGQAAFNRNPISPGVQFIMDKNAEALKANADLNGQTSDPGFLDVLNATIEKNWKMFEANPTGVDRMVSADENFSLTPELLKAAGEDRGVLPDNLHMLEDATSIPNLFALSDKALQAQERDRIIGEYGWTGTAMDIGAMLTDPVAILLTGGVEQALAPVVALDKGSKAVRIAKYMGVGGAVGAALGTAQAAATNEWNPEDIGKAMGVGMVLSGAWSSLFVKGAAKENARLAEVGRSLIEGKPLPESTVGAMRNTDWNPAFQNDTYLTHDLSHQNTFGKLEDATQAFPVIATPIDHAARVSPEALYGVRALVEDGSGARAGEVLTPPVSVVADAMHNSALNKWYSVTKPAYTEWLKEQGVNAARRVLGFDSAYKNRFFKEVADYVENDDPLRVFHPKITAAGEQFRKIMQDYANEASKAGLPGFSGGPDKLYVSKYLNHEEVIRIQREFGNDAMYALVHQAIGLELPEASQKLLERMSKGYVNRILKASFGIEDDLGAVLARGDHEEIINYLKHELGVSDNDLIAEFTDLAGIRKAEDATPSPTTSRGKRRTPIRYSHTVSAKVINGADKGKVKDLSVRDFFHNDSDMILRRYTNEMSGHIALGNMKVYDPTNGGVLWDGIRTASDWAGFKDWIMKSGANNKVNKNILEALDKDLENIKAHLTGRPTSNPNTVLNKTGKRMGDYGFLAFMQNLGLFNQTQELANVTTLVGLKALVRGIPTFGRMMEGDRSVRVDRVVQAMMDVTGFGNEAYAGGHGVRYDFSKLGQGSQWYISDVFDNSMPKAKSFVANMSLVRHVNSFLHQTTLRMIAQRFSDLAFKHAEQIKADKFKVQNLNNWFGWKDAQRMRELGLGDKEMSMVLREMLKHSEGASTGTRLRNLHMDKWTPEARSAFAHAAHSWTGRVIQRNDLGSLATWMTKPEVKMLMEFRNFVNTAWKKQTLYGLNHIDPRTATNWFAQLVAGAGSYYLYSKALSLTQANPDKFMKDRVGDIGNGDYSKLLPMGFSRAPFSSHLPMVYDTVVPTLTGTDPKFSYRTSGQSQSLFGNVPAASLAQNLYTSIGNTREAIQSGRRLSQQEIKNWAKMIVGNHVGFQMLLNLLIQDRPQRPPKNIK